MIEPIPGSDGTAGPLPGQYGRPHVYARDVYSGSGTCVCGWPLGALRHTEAAPGVPVPEWARPLPSLAMPVQTDLTLPPNVVVLRPATGG